MVKAKRGWRNPAKIILPHTKGRCKFCHKSFKNLEAHIKRKHKGKKPIKKK